MTRDHFINLATFNCWANNKISDFVTGNINEVQFDQDIMSSFPSVKKTLYHIWDAELIWLERLRGVSLIAIPSNTFHGTEKEGIVKFMENTGALHEFISNTSENFFKKSISFISTGGKSYTQEVIAILTHVFNHSTFHRGQLIMMFRQLGFTIGIPQTDYIEYCREKKLQ